MSQYFKMVGQGDMGELILTIPNSRAGDTAIDHLRETGLRDLDCGYVTSLSATLRQIRVDAFTLLEALPFTFHLVQVEEGAELAASNRLLDWHSGDETEYPRGHVLAVDQNLPLYPFAPLGTPFTLGGMHEEYLAQIGATRAHAHNLLGEDVAVAVLDTGLDAQSGILPSRFVDVDGGHIPIDTDGHGTAMAMLITAVAPEASLSVIRVLDTGHPNLWNLLAGIGVAIADCEADIINLSLGFSRFMQSCPGCGVGLPVRITAFEKLTETAVPRTGRVPIYVAAAGNSYSKERFDFPASSPRCVATGSVDSNGRRSAFSNFGSQHPKYLMAPGGREETLEDAGEDVGRGTQRPCRGSSVSAAYVSGMLALFRAQHAPLGSNSLVSHVLSNCCLMPTENRSNRLEYGAGIIRFDH